MRFKLAALVILVTLYVGVYGQNPYLPDKPKPTVARGFTILNLDNELVKVGSTPWKEKKLTVIHIWGAWCGPCRGEFPSFVKFADTNLDLQVISVATMTGISKHPLTDFLAGIKYFGSPHKLKFYLGSKDDVLFADNYYVVYVFPTTLFIDRNGQIVARVESEIDWQGPEIIQMLKDFRSGKKIMNPFVNQSENK